MKRLAVVAALALGFGCGTTNICPKSEPLGIDGGSARCIAAIDCPRPSNVLVCSNTIDHFKGCVDCVATECVYFRPGPCP
jgi:hypothetical protein